jgi:hypothetical protein
VATHFSRLLQHAWVTVELFLFPGHHTGNISQFIVIYSVSYCKQSEIPEAISQLIVPLCYFVIEELILVPRNRYAVRPSVRISRAFIQDECALVQSYNICSCNSRQTDLKQKFCSSYTRHCITWKQIVHAFSYSPEMTPHKIRE